MFKVRIPATSANIGAGFDCMGIALGLFNEIIIEKSDKLEIITDKNLPKNENNLVVKIMKNLFDRAGEVMPPFKMTQVNNIPVTSGLGSSAACIAGGLFAANRLLNDKYTTQELIKIGVETEKHPDNIVPAILGGVVNSVMCENGEIAFCRTVPEKLDIVCATPDFELSTFKARAVLPVSYSREDFVYNCSRAVATFTALSTNDTQLLKAAAGDRIHEPYRKPLIKGYAEIERFLTDCGAVAVYLSGAGPTVAGFADGNFKMSDAPHGWTLRRLKIISEGVSIT